MIFCQLPYLRNSSFRTYIRAHAYPVVSLMIFFSYIDNTFFSCFLKLKILLMESLEIMLTSKGKPCLVLDGYQHRISAKNDDSISWLCLKNEMTKCNGRVRTNHDNIVLSKTEHSCVPNLAEIEVKKTMQKCKKRVREELSVPVHKIFREEMASIYDKGYDLITESPTYKNAKTSLCFERRKILGTVENPESSLDINFRQETISFSDGKSFLHLDYLNEDGKRVLVFSGEETENFLTNGRTFFFDGTFKSCPKQFVQLYSIHVDWASTDTETNVYPAIFALLPDKKETTYRNLLLKLKASFPRWNPGMIKLDFETAAINACRQEFPNSVISGCNFHFNQCLWRKIQSLGLVKDYKENEEIRQICKMCSALAYMPLNTIEDGWILIMEGVPDNEKLNQFIDYFVEQWMDNPSLPTALWNVHNQRHRTNNAVEGWNSKLNRMIGRQQPNIQLFVKCLKDEAINVSHVIRSHDLGEVGVKRRKKYVQLDQRLDNIMKEYEMSRDLKKCLTVISHIITMD